MHKLWRRKLYPGTRCVEMKEMVKNKSGAESKVRTLRQNAYANVESSFLGLMRQFMKDKDTMEKAKQAKQVEKQAKFQTLLHVRKDDTDV